MLRSISRLALCATLVGSAFGCNKLRSAVEGGDAGESAAAVPAGDTLPSLTDGFEGEIDVSAQSKNDGDRAGGAPVPLALMVKGGKIRVDIPEQLAKNAGPMAASAKGYGILDAPAKKAYVVLDPMKEVVVIDLNTAAQQFKGMSPPGHPSEHGSNSPQATPPKVTKTGKFDTVAGYKCENWDIASDHHEATVCVAQQGFSWFSLPMTGIPTEQLWMTELLDGKHFPLRVIGYGPDGVKEEGRLEVVKIDKKALPDSDFTYPPTYALVDAAQMLRGFMMQSAGGGPGGMPGGAPGRGFPGGGVPGAMPVPPHHHP